jgi:hypothetical protein
MPAPSLISTSLSAAVIPILFTTDELYNNFNAKGSQCITYQQ